MVLDRALTQLQLMGDELVWASLCDEVHDLALAPGQGGDPFDRGLAPFGEPRAILGTLQRAVDGRKKFVGANGLLQEVGGAGLHRLHRHGDIALAGNHDRRQAAVLDVEPLQQRNAAHSGHQGVDQQAPLAALPIGGKEWLGAGVDLCRVPVFLKQLQHRFARGAVVVDDDRTTREAMLQLLQEHGHTAEIYAGAEPFLAADWKGREGCLLVDALMPGMGGIALLERLNVENSGLPAIMITGQGDIAMAVQAMKAGAADFLEKPVRSDELLAAIDRALERAQDGSRLSEWRQTAVERVAALTGRQREVMDLVAQGRPNKLIAHQLQLSQRTVENHRAAVMKRTGVASVPDLIRLIMAAGDPSTNASSDAAVD